MLSLFQLPLVCQVRRFHTWHYETYRSRNYVKILTKNKYLYLLKPEAMFPSMVIRKSSRKSNTSSSKYDFWP